MTTLIVNVDDEIHKLGIVVKFIVFKNIRNQESNEIFESYRQQGLADIISGLSKEMLKEDHVLEGYRIFEQSSVCQKTNIFVHLKHY